MGSVVAGAGVNPADQRWGFWPLLPLSSSCCNRSEGLVPELSLEFCATECFHKQLAIMPRDDSMRCIEEFMKASRFAHLCSAGVRQSLVGAFVVVSLLSASQPVEAHGDERDGEMPVTSGATTADDGVSIGELRLLYVMGIPHRFSGIPH